MKATYPNKKAFKLVCARVAAGEALTLEEVGEVFGQEFWVILVYALMDSNDASRAIAGAIARLKEEGKADGHP